MANPRADTEPYDIVKTYRGLLAADPDLTMPGAAIESLVRALGTEYTRTVSETLEHLQSLVHELHYSTPNPISMSAGTDLFMRYLTASLQQRAGSLHAEIPDFENIRSTLMTNARHWVERSRSVREQIAGFGRHFVRDGMTILTAGGSRVVAALLREVADASYGKVRFKVVYVLSDTSRSATPEGTNIVALLRGKDVPVATVSEGAAGYAMGKVDMVIVGAEGVAENGGIVSRLGTYQIGLLAKAADKPFYVVAESHKFIRLNPLGQYDLPNRQKVFEFKVKGDKVEDKVDDKGKELVSFEEAVDFTVSLVIVRLEHAFLTFVASGTDQRDHLRERNSFA
jgi:translation initiation factor eIF-2B subunit alpha